MKARVIANGKIVEVVANGNYYDTTDNKERYYSHELDFQDTTDYWTRLEHQYAGMAMRSYVSNNVYLREIREMCKEPQEMRDLIADLSILLATTLVKKLKEKEERK